METDVIENLKNLTSNDPTAVNSIANGDTAIVNTDQFQLSLTDALFKEKLESYLKEDLPLKSIAEQFKLKGNSYFNTNDYANAAQYYSYAIEVDPNNALLYSNRSAANLRLENYGYAIRDSDKAIELDRNCIKAYYRKAVANMALGHYKEALSNLELVVKVQPKSKDALEKYKACKKMLKTMAFERAIAVKEEEMKIDIDSIEVEESYDGPSLPADGTVTFEFMEQLMTHFKNQMLLHKKYAYQMLLLTLELFKKEPTLVEITIPNQKKLTICGDIHGQYYDLLNIFKINGHPSPDNLYLFNGDFVDRGSFSVECIFVLFGFKLLYPDCVYLARGNHETTVMNEMYGFQGEVKTKYNLDMFNLFTSIFNYLPLCHVINKKIGVMHGGLFSQDNVTLDDIAKINRNRQPPESGLMCDILWSDPQNEPGRGPSKRGVGFHFGPDITEQFCKLNNLDYIIRSHEVKNDGYEVAHNGKCITVFSAPNYCDTAKNKGAFVTVTGENLSPNFTVFDAVEHPNVRAMAYATNLYPMLRNMF